MHTSPLARPLVLSIVLALSCLVRGQAGEPEFGVLIRLGLRDKEATDWSGSIAVQGADAVKLQGWRFQGKSRIAGPLNWVATTRDPGGPKGHRGRRIEPVGVLVHGRGAQGAKLTVSTSHGNMAFTLDQLGLGKSVSGPGSAMSAERVPVPTTLSDSDREDDHPSACIGEAGTLWCVWQSYENQSERLYVSRYDGAVWAKPQVVPGVKGDLYKSACAWVGGRLWVVWSQFEDGDWNLKAASFDGSTWTNAEPLTREKGADVEPAMAARGNDACLVWQAFRGGHSDVWLKPMHNGQWAEAQPVTTQPGNDWMPAVAVSPDGTATVVWDTYRHGNYDVYFRQLARGKFGPEAPAAATEMFEAYATVAADPGGRVWIAYEEGTANWGKDQGAVVPRPTPGTGLYTRRVVRVRVLDQGKLLSPAAQPDSAMPGPARRLHEKPRLTVDGAGRVWLALRWPMTVRRYLRSRGHFRGARAWESYAMTYDGNRWLAPVYLADSLCRLDSYAIACGLPEGGLAAVWHTDRRTITDLRKPVKNRVVAACLPSPSAPAPPKLSPANRPAPLKPEAKDLADTARVRGYRCRIDGQEHRILRGDLHRHTEVSWDGSGDGPMVDVYRYAIDAGALDFLEITDHNQRTGPDLEYVWWRTQKLTDVYNNAPHFITLFGYERSLGFPNGHRNIINATRGFRTFPMTHVPGKGLAPDDTKQLYRYARKTGSIIISHTSGTRMGTDWRDNDPEVEPVVEIYQGARTSYEYEGAPKSATPGDRHARGSGYQPEGFVWRAWEKGLRLGVIASSDHGSTHISYASVYAAAPTRQAILDSLRRRHTFGATDNIILELRTNRHFMGDEFTQAEPPKLQVRAIGCAELTELAIVKDLNFVYSTDPQGSQVELEWQDRDFGPGTHLYYIRCQQADGQIAWSSPIWITKP